MNSTSCQVLPCHLSENGFCIATFLDKVNYGSTDIFLIVGPSIDIGNSPLRFFAKITSGRGASFIITQFKGKSQQTPERVVHVDKPRARFINGLL